MGGVALDIGRLFAVVALTMAACLAAWPTTAAAARPPSIETLLERPTFNCATLSPDGRSVAYVVRRELADHRIASVVMVQRLDNSTAAPALTESMKGLEISWLVWKDNTRLLAGVALADVERAGDKPESPVKQFYFADYVIAVDRDGKNGVQFLKTDKMWTTAGSSQVRLLDRLRRDPDHVLVTAPNLEGLRSVYRIDVHTGQAVLIEAGRNDIFGWVVDHDGDIIARWQGRLDENILQGRAPGQREWTVIARIKRNDFKTFDDYAVYGAAEKPNQFYVGVNPASPADGPFRRLHIYDVATKTLSAPIWPPVAGDVESVVYDDDDTGRLDAVCYTTDVEVCDFKDRRETAHYRGLVHYFHGDQNVTALNMGSADQWWLFQVSGGQQPGAYYLYDSTSSHIQHLADQFDDLAAERLGDVRPYSFTARDGVSVPGYLTRPPGVGAGRLPLVVMPHGGPEYRDMLAYDARVQVLATRGYLVYQPNFRGSSGYGAAYAQAGYGQWDGRMADDITDGVRSLIAQGLVDPARICIVGGSYGGYAALLAGAKHPELYKCVVSRAGIADVDAFVRFKGVDNGKDSATYRYWVKSIGDPVRNAAALKAASPTNYARDYRPAVLLIHGDSDRVVSIDQSRFMERALWWAGHKAQLVTFNDEGHDDWEPPHEVMAMQLTLDFVRKHIAPAPTAP